MKDLFYLLRRMTAKELANSLGIVSANISIWKKNKQFPVKYVAQIRHLKKIRSEYDRKGKK